MARWSANALTDPGSAATLGNIYGALRKVLCQMLPLTGKGHIKAVPRATEQSRTPQWRCEHDGGIEYQVPDYCFSSFVIVLTPPLSVTVTATLSPGFTALNNSPSCTLNSSA